MARYGEAFRRRVVARMLPPESAELGALSKEVGVSVQTLEKWREEVQTMPARGRAWSAAARLEAVITTAARWPDRDNAERLRVDRRPPAPSPSWCAPLGHVARSATL
jgi:transposase-like protein